MPSANFVHLESRCNLLINRFLEPAIAVEQAALREGQSVPTPDFDDFAAFRLLSHAELEGYFESKALECLTDLDVVFKSGQFLTSKFSGIMFLYLWQERGHFTWPINKVDDASYLKQMAQEALGFGRKFITANNGIKEASIQVLSALMGFFPNELDAVLVNELNQYGKKRGDVAHKSWHFNTRTFDSADIEKYRLKTILNLTKSYYER